MKRIIIFWLIGTICALALGIIAFRWNDLSDLIFWVSCVFTSCLAFCIFCIGRPEKSLEGYASMNTWRNLFRIFIVAAAATAEYCLFSKLTESCPLFCSISVALVASLFLVWFLNVIYEKLPIEDE